MPREGGDGDGISSSVVRDIMTVQTYLFVMFMFLWNIAHRGAIVEYVSV